MLWFFISAIILLAVECANAIQTSTNVTAWLASRDPPMIILQNNQMIPLTIDCHQNGKTYKEGESWFTGHLLYKCSKFGAHIILGCRTRKGRPMNIGETYIDEFIAYQCFEENSNKLIKLSVAALFDQIGKTKIGYPSIGNLPQGWKIVDSNGQIIPLNRIRVVASYSINSTPTVTVCLAALRSFH